MQATYIESHVPGVPFLRPSTRRSLSSKAAVEEELRETVYIIDRDGGVRNELSEVLASVNVRTLEFATASDYLSLTRKDLAACLIVETHLPDMSGLDLQKQLAERAGPPVIFMSGVCDIATAVSAMKAGAVEFLAKPVDPAALVGAVRAAFTVDRRARQRRADLAKLMDRYALLTPREREVLPLIVGGLLNKQAASVLGISEVTLQIHRSQVTRKMQADSFADLVRMALKLRIPYWRENLSISNQFPGCLNLCVSGLSRGVERSTAKTALIQTPDRQRAYW
jgi:FixJ family two-component response regulator